MAKPAGYAAAILCTSLVVGACSGPTAPWGDEQAANKSGRQASLGQYKVGKPYRVDGVYYYPAVDYDYVKTGIASWYGAKFHGKPTANGETYDMNALTAAHRTLPMPSVVRVTNLENGRAITVRVNDRGPFIRGRIIDLSRRTAQLLGFRYKGTARVRVEIIADESRRIAALSQRGKGLGGQGINVNEPTPPVVSVEPLSPVTTAPSVLKETARAAARKAGGLTRRGAVRPAEARMRIEQVRPTALYIQAGSFIEHGNAARLRTELARHGTARVVPARIGKERFFRVMLGPFQNLAAADRALSLVFETGHPRARLVVDRPQIRDVP